MKQIIYLPLFILVINLFKSQNVNKNLRPNIIFIMADDHAIQAISAYGHPIGKLAPTPNIDKIAKEGTIFKKNYCTNSICGPSRAVILTGKHSHINGFRMNGDVFNGSQPTFPKMLRKAGYTTAMIGKWHLHGYPEGFDYLNILNDQGNYYNPQFIKKKDSALLDGRMVNNTAHWNQKLPDTLIVNGYATDLITEDALKFIENNKDSGKPFMMMVHHKAPHRNWMPALRHLNKYENVKFPLPDIYFTDHKGSTASKKQLQTIYRDM